jgi:hypothetical protein
VTSSVVQKATNPTGTLRRVATTMGAEGASLEQAKPDETLRQKDPVPDQTLESSPRYSGDDTDGESLV